MAYGGAALGPPAASGGPTTVRQVKLDKECELRVEVADTPFRLRLLNGSAEIFGTEIPPEIWLSFPPRLKFAVSNLLNLDIVVHLVEFTW
jgi:polyribonucleotide 5'-hydroxyl-kinase